MLRWQGGMPSALPSPDEADALPVDRLALRVLELLRDQDRSGTQLDRLNVINRGVGGPLGRATEDAYLQALTEAWDWLVAHGLIGGSHPARHHHTGTFITRLGNAVLDDPRGLARLRAQARLDVDLHSLIREQVRSQFLLGDYELAAIAALKQVEIRVRTLANLPDSLVGKALVTQAFREGGPLRDPTLDPSESDALLSLFVGAVGVFRNPVSHQQVEYQDVTEASEVVLFADLLLRLLDQVEGRLGAVDSGSAKE